ncbi:hypothetical protein Tco_0199707 [Tanacetum coccineum]
MTLSQPLMEFYGVECFELERVIRGQGKWERVWVSYECTRGGGFAVKTGGMGWYGFGGSGGLAGVVRRIGPALKSSHSLCQLPQNGCCNWLDGLHHLVFTVFINILVGFPAFRWVKDAFMSFPIPCSVLSFWLLAGRVNMLFRDRRGHAHTRLLMETEAGMSREAWGRAMDASDLAHGGVISLRTTVHAQMSEITELQSADRRRQRAISELLETDRRRREEMRELRAADRTRQQQIVQTLTVMQTLQREMVPLQGLVTTLQGQVTALQGQVMTLQGQVTTLQGQQGPAGGPAQPELPEEAGSSS